MSKLARQRESLMSGFNKVTVPVPPEAGTQVSRILPTGIGGPLDLTGTLRNAPMPYLSVWMGIRPAVDVGPFDVSFFSGAYEVGLIPYSDQAADNLGSRKLRPTFIPLRENASSFKVMGAQALLAWPPGNLLARISLQNSGIDPLFGDLPVDFWVAWAVCANAAYPAFPALQDTQDL